MRIRINYPEGLHDSKKFMRCETDGILVTPRLLREGGCGGHRMRVTNYLTLFEWVMWKLGRLQ